MVRNAATPEVRVDPEERQVLIDGEPVTLEPARELPLNWTYFLSLTDRPLLCRGRISRPHDEPSRPGASAG